jgi:malto-oligosyltrehalose synthase
VYASPLLASVPGGHGYDIVDPTRLSPELGSDEDFEALWAPLRDHGMGLVLDIVPNHLAADADHNPWWRDVLARGRRSRFARWFDIDWDAPTLDGRVLVPVLGATLEEVLEAGEIGMESLGRGRASSGAEPVVRYLDRTFPIAEGTATPAELRAASRLPGALAAILDRQPYRLAHWRLANPTLNWRRFFDVPELVAIRQELPEVFEATHRLVLATVERGRSEGVPVGLRIDHVDGLADPLRYLERLRAATGPDTFIAVEKILARGEDIPRRWPVAGESGYAFIDAADGLFIDPGGLAGLDVTAAAARGPLPPFVVVARDGKRQAIEELFGADRDRLTRIALRIAALDTSARNLAGRDIERAIVELTVALPVYRTYLGPGDPVRTSDRRIILRAARDATASASSPAVRHAVGFLRATMLSVAQAPADGDVAELTRRWQQLCPAVTAKGVEDTALYRDPRVPSRAEVGSSPGDPVTTVRAFHDGMRSRHARWPGAMSASSTHDTKRSEDARSRLHVLSEVSDAWAERLDRWRRWNAPHRTTVHGSPAPDGMEEMGIYQALLAIWPARAWAGVDAALIERLQAYVRKAAREAKIHTGWLHPDHAYEAALRGFVAAITSSSRTRFARDLAAFARFLAFHGAIGGLAATVLKVAAPGVPDIYQGTELWNPRLVDPDNRAPVDFTVRDDLLASLDGPGTPPNVPELREGWRDGRLKLLVLSRALRARGRHTDLFARGRYLPLRARGERPDHVVAFARRLGRGWAVVAVPRLSARLAGGLASTESSWPLGRQAWGTTVIELPDGAPTVWRDAFTDRLIRVRTHHGVPVLRVAEAFDALPVALLAPGADGPTCAVMDGDGR